MDTSNLLWEGGSENSNVLHRSHALTQPAAVQLDREKQELALERAKHEERLRVDGELDRLQAQRVAGADTAALLGGLPGNPRR